MTNVLRPGTRPPRPVVAVVDQDLGARDTLNPSVLRKKKNKAVTPRILTMRRMGMMIMAALRRFIA